MAESRPAIPAQIGRDVLIEAGYRCAMPNCRERTVQIHHIVDWSIVKEHTFDNLIALCANCHMHVTSGKIERKAVQQIKANLSVLQHRYGDLERRYLRKAAETKARPFALSMPRWFDLQMKYLIDDGLVRCDSGIGVLNATPLYDYVLTDKGDEFVHRWLAADELN